MADPVSDPAPDAPEDEAPSTEVPFTSRIIGLMVLVAVFGALYLLAIVMPKAGDVVGESVEALIPTESEANSVASPVVDPTPVQPVPEPPLPVEVESTPSVEDAETYLKRQVAAAFPNPDEVEVIAVLFSEAKDEFLAMYKVSPDAVQEEIILTRDKFGRYLSAEGAPVKMMVLAPKE